MKYILYGIAYVAVIFTALVLLMATAFVAFEHLNLI